jgi:hypothetical protein
LAALASAYAAGGFAAGALTATALLGVGALIAAMTLR